MDDPLKYLQPEFTLGPYTSEREHIFFWMQNKESIQPGRHKITILTSRRGFTCEVEINDVFESAENHFYNHA